MLGIGDGMKQYFYGKKLSSTLSPCSDSDKKNPQTECGLYVVDHQNFPQAFNLVDSFVPEEEKKRVKIVDLKFYIS